MVVWRIIFLANVWVIWRRHNKVVFHVDAFDEVGCLELCRFDLTWWVKAKWGDLVPLVASMIRCPGSFYIPMKIKEGFRN